MSYSRKFKLSTEFNQFYYQARTYSHTLLSDAEQCIRKSHNKFQNADKSQRWTAEEHQHFVSLYE